MAQSKRDPNRDKSVSDLEELVSEDRVQERQTAEGRGGRNPVFYRDLGVVFIKKVAFGPVGISKQNWRTRHSKYSTSLDTNTMKYLL